MISPTLARFQSQVSNLIKKLHLSNTAVISLGVTLAATYGMAAGQERADLHKALDLAVDELNRALQAGGPANDR